MAYYNYPAISGVSSFDSISRAALSGSKLVNLRVVRAPCCSAQQLPGKLECPGCHHVWDYSSVRVSYAVSKRVGNAVIRNKVRRRLRECINMRELSPGDYLFVAKPQSQSASFAELKAAVDRVVSAELPRRR